METKVPETRLAAFRKAYLENGLVAYKAGLAIGMKPADARANTWKYARLLRVEIREALTAMGYGPEKLTKLFIACLSARSKTIRLQALDRAFKLRDDYPAPKETALPQGPVTVIFNTNIEHYKEQSYAPHKIIEQPGVQKQSQGNAGGGTSESAITGGSLCDPEESRRETKA